MLREVQDAYVSGHLYLEAISSRRTGTRKSITKIHSTIGTHALKS
jgi:hypothetical protein